MNLITDRTEADVTALGELRKKIKTRTATPEEWAEWLGGMVGAYNASDLNRAGAAVQYVANRLYLAGYYAAVQPKTDWTSADVPRATQMQRYLGDIKAIRNMLDVGTISPAPDDMSGLTYEEANNIERILLTVDDAVDRMLRSVDLGWALGIAHLGLYGGL